MSSLSGKIAVVTGASAGIGRATVKALAAAGARVVASARRMDRLRELANELGVDRVATVKADASRPHDIDNLIEKALQIGNGKLDIVIANAGHGLAGGVLSSDRSRWETMYQLNVIGAAHLMRKSAEIMVKQQSGDIIALGSVAGLHISPFSGFYGSTKFAVAAIAEAMRREICQHKVRVSIIKPAIVESEFQQVAGYTAENFGKSVAKFGKVLDPDDVARAIMFIVSQPAHVHVNELVIRPVGQDYP